MLAAWTVWQFLGLPGSFFWFARRRADAENARVRALPLRGLLEETKRILRSNDWRRFSAASEVLTKTECSQPELIEQLRALYADAARDDERTGEGRGRV